MKPRPFYIVGPTAVGKSEIAAQAAERCGAEIVSADAFQIYAGLDLLTAKPDETTLRLVPHHLIGTCPPGEEMNAEIYRRATLDKITEIQGRGRLAFVVGGTGMYVQALTHGLSPLPPADPELRMTLEPLSESELLVRLEELDPALAAAIDRKNKRRLLRAVEICLLTGQPASAQRLRAQPAEEPAGVFLWREREELHTRIDARVEAMFAEGVVEEVQEAGEVGRTAEQTLGLRQIRELLAGRIAEEDCIASIQQATRQYAKRQLTWFRGQTNFAPLNLSLTGSSHAIEWIVREARLLCVPNDD